MTPTKGKERVIRKELNDILYFQGRWESTPAEGERWTEEHRHQYKIKRLLVYLEELGVNL